MGKYIGIINNYPTYTGAQVAGIIINNDDTEIININRVYMNNLSSKNMNQSQVDFVLSKVVGVQDYALSQVGLIVPQNKSCSNLKNIIIGAGQNDRYGGTRAILRRTYAVPYTVITSGQNIGVNLLFNEYANILDFNNPNVQPIVLRKGEGLIFNSIIGPAATTSPCVFILEISN